MLPLRIALVAATMTLAVVLLLRGEPFGAVAAVALAILLRRAAERRHARAR